MRSVSVMLVLLIASLCDAKSTILSSEKRAVPALQPADVYDSDYPMDTASLTPQELRYKAQANYAKAVAQLKREAAEAEAARKEMEKVLAEYKAAQAAAAKAKEDAEWALKHKQAASDAAVDADTKAKVERAEATTAEAAIKREQADLVAAQKAEADAAAGAKAAEAKIAELQGQIDALCKKREALEAEGAKAGATFKSHQNATSRENGGISAAESDYLEAKRKAAAELDEAKRAKKEAELLKSKLAEAEKDASATKKDGATIKDEIAKEQKEFDLAKE